VTHRGRKRAVIAASLLVLAALLAAAFVAPAGAHVGGTINHLWNGPGHIKSKAMQLFYTKAQSDSKYLGSSSKAADANLLDGQDSASFLNSAGGGLERVGQTVWIADGGVGSQEIADGSIRDQDLGSFKTITVSSTSLVEVQGLFFQTLNGVTSGRIIISANGNGEGGSGTVKVYRGASCTGTEIASFAIGGSGGNAWTQITPAFTIDTNLNGFATVCASAASSGDPIILRSIDLQVS
jgi:hypothetical protein